MTIKKGDFVELELTGKIKETNEVFDVTSESLAKENNLYNPSREYGARTICIGEHAIVHGLDEFLVGKELKKYTVDLPPAQAFGKKDPKLLKILPISTFTKQQIRPFPGLQINIDGVLGTVKTVSGGRVIVDFNHPLAGRNIVYDIEVKKIVTDVKQKIASLLHSYFGKAAEFEYANTKLTIKSKEMPKQVQDFIHDKMKKFIPEVKEFSFETKKPASKA